MPALLHSLGTLLSRSGGSRDGALTLHREEAETGKPSARDVERSSFLRSFTRPCPENPWMPSEVLFQAFCESFARITVHNHIRIEFLHSWPFITSCSLPVCSRTPLPSNMAGHRKRPTACESEPRWNLAVASQASKMAPIKMLNQSSKKSQRREPDPKQTRKPTSAAHATSN